jgi:hypothetical protein
MLALPYRHHADQDDTQRDMMLKHWLTQDVIFVYVPSDSEED